MELDYFKILPLLSLLVFFLPKQTKGYWSFLVVLIGVVVALLGALKPFAGINLSFLPTFDPISIIFILAISGVAIGCSAYTVGFLKDSKKSGMELSVHYVSIVVLVYSMFFVIGAQSKFEFLIFWELMTLSSFVLVLFNGVKKDVLHAALGYLILMHIGFFCIFYAMLSYGGEAIFGYGTMPFGIWVLFLIGFGLKSGVFPLHIWLPVTYPAAPSNVSALMSGGMINMGIYGIVKTTFAVQDLLSAGYVLFVIGVVSAIYGIVKASTQGSLKKLFAYSSIENMGIVFLGLGMGAIGKASANMPLALIGISGALLHVINHANYKSVLFMSAGSIVKTTGSDELNKLGGLFQRMPITGWMFLFAVLGICAIVPFSGFFSEFILMQGMFESIATGNGVLIALVGLICLAIVGGLTIITFVKAIGVAMLGKARSCQAQGAVEMNKMMTLGFVIPVVSILVGGVVYPIFILSYATEIFSVNADVELILERLYWVEGVGLAVVAMVGIGYAVKKKVQKRRANVIAPTWGCGFSNISPEVQYGAHSSSAELESAIIGKKVADIFDNTDIYPTQQAKFDKNPIDKTNFIFTHFSTNVLRRLTARLALFQTGKVNHYILHAFLLIILVLVLSIMSLL